MEGAEQSRTSVARGLKIHSTPSLKCGRCDSEGAMLEEGERWGCGRTGREVDGEVQPETGLDLGLASPRTFTSNFFSMPTE
jgi:hypothetical protein